MRSVSTGIWKAFLTFLTNYNVVTKQSSTSECLASQSFWFNARSHNYIAMVRTGNCCLQITCNILPSIHARNQTLWTSCGTVLSISPSRRSCHIIQGVDDCTLCYEIVCSDGQKQKHEACYPSGSNQKLHMKKHYGTKQHGQVGSREKSTG